MNRWQQEEAQTWNMWLRGYIWSSGKWLYIHIQKEGQGRALALSSHLCTCQKTSPTLPRPFEEIWQEMGPWGGQAAATQWQGHIDHWTHGWRVKHRTFHEVCEPQLKCYFKNYFVIALSCCFIVLSWFRHCFVRNVVSLVSILISIHYVNRFP